MIFCFFTPGLFGVFLTCPWKISFLWLNKKISKPFLASFSILLNVITLSSIFNRKISILLTKTCVFFNNPAEGADRIPCSALSPLKPFWCRKLS